VSFELFTPWLIWALTGFALVLLELFLPGFIVIFFGFGCLVTALVLLLFDLSLTQQILLFLSASLLSLAGLRKWAHRIFSGTAPGEPSDNLDDFPHDAKVPVTRNISSREHGRIRYRGTDWFATADEDIEAGDMVEIIRYADTSRQIFFVRKIK